jgi:hypothetical protein
MEATHPNESCGYPKPKQKRTKFEGTEKMLRDALLTGIAAKVCEEKRSNDGKLPKGFVANFVKASRGNCPNFKIDHTTIRENISVLPIKRSFLLLTN